MIRVCIVCEGQTEVEFVRSCITPYLFERNVHAYPSILQAPSGRHRGGNVTVDRLARFMSHQYYECDRITTFVDFYGFSGADGRTRGELEQAIASAVQERIPAINTNHLLPYVQMHEFEALLFSDINDFQWVIDGWNEEVREKFEAIRAQFPTPEEINNSRETAPSKRILATFAPGTYSKTEHGPLIAEAIGVENLKAECPQFGQWMQTLESWGDIG